MVLMVAVSGGDNRPKSPANSAIRCTSGIKITARPRAVRSQAHPIHHRRRRFLVRKREIERQGQCRAPLHPMTASRADRPVIGLVLNRQPHPSAIAALSQQPGCNLLGLPEQRRKEQLLLSIIEMRLMTRFPTPRAAYRAVQLIEGLPSNASQLRFEGVLLFVAPRELVDVQALTLRPTGLRNEDLGPLLVVGGVMLFARSRKSCRPRAYCTILGSTRPTRGMPRGHKPVSAPSSPKPLRRRDRSGWRHAIDEQFWERPARLEPRTDVRSTSANLSFNSDVADKLITWASSHQLRLKYTVSTSVWRRG